MNESPPPRPIQRERVAWAIALLVLTFSAFRISPTLAQREDDYVFVRTLVDIMRQVDRNYVEAVDEKTLQQAAINGMLEKLDPYTIYVPPARKEEFDRMLEGTFKGVGVQLSRREDGWVEVVTPIDGSPAWKAGVMAGDLIVKVNNESMAGKPLSEVVSRIGGELGTQVTLTVRRGRKEIDLTMKRDEIVVPVVKGFARKADNSWDYYVSESPRIAYVRITQFTPGTMDAAGPVIRGLLAEGMQGLILDLRWNPGGSLQQALELLDLFVERGTLLITRGRARPEDRKTARSEGTLPYFPMVVLVNEHSASASEIVAGSLQDNRRAVVIGARSFGKGSVQEVINLDGNAGELKITTAYYYLPNGRLVHRRKDAADWGVEPNILVPTDEETERLVRREREEREMARGNATRPASATRPADVQLQRAVDTLIGYVIFSGKQEPPATGPKPPTTGPAQAATRAAPPASGMR